MRRQYFLLIAIFVISFWGFTPNIKAQMSEPKAYWNFNNGTEINASFVSDATGQYSGENNNGTWISNGYNGGGIEFSCFGDNYACSIKTPSIPTNNSYTLLFRMKIGDISNADNGREIFSAFESHAYIYGGAAQNENEINQITTAQMGNFSISNDSNWHHYAFIWGTDGKHYFYKDGVLVGYANGPGIRSVSSQFIFGVAGSPIAPNIQLDEIKIYDQVLTAEQISEEYNYNKLLCTSDAWSCDNWNSCSVDGQQTRSCNKTSNCEGGVSSPATTQSCSYVLPCTSNSWSCGDWGFCSVNGAKTRICNKVSNCEGGVASPAISQSCVYSPPVAACTANDWSCGSWNACSSSGSQTRSCSKISNCSGGVSAPVTTQTCTYIPICERDIWECDSWNECSLNGIQTRSCKKTYDCSLVENAAPPTSKSCEVSKPINNGTEENINREQIFKSTVKLICMIDQKSGWQGSGTIIDQYGTILTNRHVILGTTGACKVGFIKNEDDSPSYIEMADVKRISTDSSSNGDMAILKIRNTGNKKFTAIDISQGNSDNLKSGDSIMPAGYPNEDLFGQTISFTEGAYLGKGTTLKVCGGSYNVNNFFKTDALIDHGNSGGGAYQKKNGYFMGMPTLGTSCDPNIPSRVNYILSINTINKWLNSLSGGYGVTRNNFSTSKNYYSQSVDIKDINLGFVKILDPSNNTVMLNKDNSNKSNSGTNQASTNIKLKGYILLQVESVGEAWYVNPVDGKRYYMKDGATAYELMRKFGLGITNSDLAKLPQENEVNNYPSLVNKLRGKILLQVQEHGEAWYIHPKTGYRYYMKDGGAAYSLMRFYSLGITNKDLEKIPIGNL